MVDSGGLDAGGMVVMSAAVCVSPTSVAYVTPSRSYGE